MEDELKLDLQYILYSNALVRTSLSRDCFHNVTLDKYKREEDAEPHIIRIPRISLNVRI